MAVARKNLTKLLGFYPTLTLRKLPRNYSFSPWYYFLIANFLICIAF